MNVRRAWAVADKEARYIVRDWRSLTVSVLLPVFLLILYGYAINFDVRRIRLAVYDGDGTRSSRELVRAVTSTDYFRLVGSLASLEEADKALESGAAKVVLAIPRGFERDLVAGRGSAVQSVVNGADSLTSSIAIGYLEGMIQDWVRRRAEEEMPRGAVGRPIAVEMRVWYNEELSSVVFITPGLVVVILMMLAALLTSQTVVRERERGTMEGLVVSPVTAGEVIAGKLAPYVVIAVVDVGLVAAAGRLVFGVPLRGDPALLLGLTLVYLVAALGAGLLISVSVRSQQLAHMVALVGTLMPSIVLTGFVFPVASMPKVLQGVVQLHPGTHFMVIVRAMALKGVGLEVVWPRALALAVLAAALVAASVLRFEKRL